MADDFPDGIVFIDLTPLRDPGLVLDGLARQLGVDERDVTPLASLLRRDAARPPDAGGAGQLRARAGRPGRRGRAAGSLPGRGRAGHEPRRRCGSGPAGSTRSPRWCCRARVTRTPSESPAVQLFLDRADAAGRGPAPDAARDRRRDLPPAGWHPAGHRAGRGPAAGAAARRTAGPADPPAAGAGRRSARPAGPAEDHARRHRLELRAAGRAGTAAVPAAVRVRRRRHARTRWKRSAPRYRRAGRADQPGGQQPGADAGRAGARRTAG